MYVFPSKAIAIVNLQQSIALYLYTTLMLLNSFAEDLS